MELTNEQIEAIRDLGIDRVVEFAEGTEIVYEIPGGKVPAIAVVQLGVSEIRAGIYVLDDPGGGDRFLWKFRDDVLRLAAVFGKSSYELYGATVTNQEMANFLIRRGFVKTSCPCPPDLGGGQWEILTRTFEV